MMSPILRLFIEQNIDLLETDPKKFLAKAYSKLPWAESEELINCLHNIQFDIDGHIEELLISKLRFLFDYLSDEFEKPEENIMRRKPRSKNDGIFAGGLGIDCFYQGVIVSILTVIAFYIGEYIETGHLVFRNIADSEDGMTMAFLTLSMTEMFHAFNARSINHSIFSKSMLKNQNKLMWAAFAFSLVATVLVIYTPGLNTAFDFTAIDAKEFFVAMALGATIIPFVELSKVITNAIYKSKSKKN